MITGLDCLTIPCEVASEKELKSIRPIYRQPKTNGGGWYECPRCHMEFHRYPQCARHMGLVMNIPEGCKVKR